ncbi:Uu.00g061070.m01.CDS01 [Anthostomella pinea]|uniref:Uu.00g061070.m01.CDS01 n=1 Tax=Anthostomella pinea TaxID=933095 RepID=A0AAI8VSD6_9PEZI|nr:Uu.00g061070.m01.CDS01 [Anthostomella pinea]
MSIDKQEHSQEHSEESVASSPENETGPSVPPESQPVKRKGGRKPIYATSEERKQRNRQAQAAFRERRTEYIKQLEDALKAQETNLTNLQAAHRGAADECLMLRYKNSLLERILLEKGIDVQAELRAKTGSPTLGPTHMPQNMVQPPPIQRGMLNRQHHPRRSGSSIAPKLEPGMPSLPPPNGINQALVSPKSRPTPPSHAASPINPTPPYGGHMAASSPAASDHTGMRPAMPPPPKQHMPPMPGMGAAQRQQMMQQQPTSGPRPPAFYPTPSFQNHFQQLGKLTQQEYDAPADMIDEPELDNAGPGPYPSGFPVNHQPGMSMQPPTSAAPGQPPIASAEHGGQGQGQGYPSMTQLLDPALDWDPFGLSASMAFPTQFSFDTSNMR